MKALPLAISSALVAIASVVALAPAACDDVRAHIYAARLYEPDRGCLDPPSSIDVVDGDDPGLGCALTCLASVPVDAGDPAMIYVSTMCPPYPTFYDVSGASPDCVRALAAAKDSVLCSADGGTRAPADAGADAADTGADAADTGDAAPADASPDVSSDASDAAADGS